jgi:hypothetical protein
LHLWLNSLNFLSTEFRHRRPFANCTIRLNQSRINFGQSKTSQTMIQNYDVDETEVNQVWIVPFANLQTSPNNTWTFLTSIELWHWRRFNWHMFKQLFSESFPNSFDANIHKSCNILMTKCVQMTNKNNRVIELTAFSSLPQ